MTIDTEVRKAKQAQRRLLEALNEEQSWAEKHPGWMTLITAVIFIAFIAALLKGCHW